MKDNKIVQSILEKFLFIGFTVQAGFGIAWIVKNIGYVQLFGESARNVSVSGTFVCSIYTGVLYPAFLLLVRAAGMAIGFPWYSFIYIIQLSLAYVSVWVFLKSFGGKGYGRFFYAWASLVITTFPLVLQNHLAILSGSFTMSFVLMELAFVKRSWDAESLKGEGAGGRSFSFDMGRVCLFWLLAALMEWDYLFIGAIPVLVLLVRAVIILVKRSKVRESKKHPLNAFFPVLICVLFAVLIVGMYRLTESRQEKALPSKSIETALFDRTAWTAYISKRWNWRDDMKELVGEEMLESARLNRENVKLEIEPEIEKSLGIKGAKAFYKQIAMSAMKTNGSEIIHISAVDFAGYVIPPVITGMLFNKESFVSFNSRNYDIMKRNAPVLTKWFVDYSILWFGISLMEGCILWLLRFFEAMRDKKKIKFGVILMIVGTCAAIAVRNTFLGCAMYDYKRSVIVTALWMALAILSVSKKREN